MKFSGEFINLGVQEAPSNSEKKWSRIVFAESIQLCPFYINDPELLKVAKSLPVSKIVSATVEINFGKKGTFCSLISIDAVQENN